MPARVILGVRADVPDHSDVDYVFVSVVAEVDDGRFQPATTSRFPPRGTVFVHRTLFPEPFEQHGLGFWDCEESSQFRESNKGSRFHATRRRIDIPCELVPVDCPSTASAVAREILLKTGLTSLHPLEGRDVLLEFTDHVVAGPVRLKRMGPIGKYVCETAAPLDRPLPAWKSLAGLHPVPLYFGLATRFFVWPLPQAGRFVYLMCPEQILRSLLKLGCRSGPGTYLFTEAQRNEIVQRLAEIDDPTRVVPEYRQHLQHLLDQSLSSGKDLAGWYTLVREHPDVQRQLAEYKQQIADEARREVQAKEAALLKRVTALQADEKTLTESLAALQRDCAAEETRKQQLSAGVAEAIIARALQAQEDVGHLLAEVAVLQPFLGGAPAPSPVAEPARVRLTTERHQGRARRLESLDEAARHLTLSLARLGLQVLAARTLAREILAAANLGQVLLFRGSFARPLARTVACCLTGANWQRVNIPIGLVASTDMHDVLQAALDPGKEWSGLLIDGANRSCIDAYGPMVGEILTERQVGLGERAPRLLILATLADGASSLSPDPSLMAFGPLWHTDFLRWNPPQEPAESDGHLAPWSWPHQDGPDRGVEDLLDALCPVPSELWRRNVTSACRRLTGWPSKETVHTAMEAILFGWVLPRCLACGVDLQAHADRIRQEFSDLAKLDPRLKRLLRTQGVEGVM